MNKSTWLIACATLLALAGCASTPAPKTIADVAATTPELSTLDGLIKQAGLTDTLKGTGPYTVFAPTNAAFKAVPAKTLESLGKDPEALKGVLLFHVVPGTVMAADVKPGNVKTAQGANIAVSKAGTMVTVEDAVVEKADIRASNGVVHEVDRVLMPPKK
ncbi:fasciclin domain-containing protein [Rivibacter subsaxonicus]|uniref:Putative surface protein with fasciclin (FAS1) repeats n=1 Tax=Rivibacter subsaxonicus TaxID=457575 RepID=A0A4Q7VP79_9BURK|nr:fasciclin domain-containing protein [Rivibacter subsaxonicus]RZT98044.1 putative surface protein with fasciclin (FAS1) repeats [Rivibacter subsaxonicus]